MTPPRFALLAGFSLAFLGMITMVPRSAHADAIPDGVRGVGYSVTFENLTAFPDWVFYIYPTTNSGYAYQVEPGKSLVSLMSVAGKRGGEGTFLHAVKATEFAKSPKNTYPHGDNGEMVQVFSPIPGAVKSKIAISAPGTLVTYDAPEKSLTRVFRIVNVGDKELELAVSKNEMTFKDGTKKELPLGQEIADASKPPQLHRDVVPSATASASSPAPDAGPSAPAKRAGCAGCTVTDRRPADVGPAGFAFLSLALVVARRAARPSRRFQRGTGEADHEVGRDDSEEGDRIPGEALALEVLVEG